MSIDVSCHRQQIRQNGTKYVSNSFSGLGIGTEELTKPLSVASLLSENVKSHTIRVFVEEVSKAVLARAKRLAKDKKLASMISNWSREDGMNKTHQ